VLLGHKSSYGLQACDGHVCTKIECNIVI